MTVLGVVSVVLLSIPPVGVRLDAGGGATLSSPQNEYFGLGASGALSAEVALLRYLKAQLQLGYTRLERTSSSPLPGAGTLLTLGPGIRVHRPLEDARVVPWAEALIQWGFSGGSRLPLGVGVGTSLRPNPNLPLWFGLFTRLTYVLGLGGDEPGFKTYNATVFSFGFSVEYLHGQGNAPLLTPVAPSPVSTTETPPEVSRDGGTPKSFDRDGDGIADNDDICPAGAEDFDGFQDTDGCPEPDNDKDGIADSADACPNQAGPPDLKGCPDTDGDFLADKDDPCPRVAGKTGSQGCPSYKRLRVDTAGLQLRGKVQFPRGSAKLSPSSIPLLSEVAQALIDRPGTCVRIEGHTDNQGTRDANLRLSAAQANAVRTYLVRYGIAIGRLGAQGFADKQPLYGNDTASGRENNRRVEFVFVPCVSEAP